MDFGSPSQLNMHTDHPNLDNEPKSHSNMDIENCSSDHREPVNESHQQTESHIGDVSETPPGDKDIWIPPDGGYGWVIVLAGFLLWFEYGHIAQSGIFMLRLAPDFNVTNSKFSGLNSIQGSLGLLLGMFFGPLIGHFGCRPMVLVGTLFLSAGYISSSFVSYFPYMYLTYGVLPSLGIGILYCSTVVAVNQYFVKNSAKANALALTGYNVSIFAWPPLGAWLCDDYGWRTTFLVEGTIHAIIGVLCAALLRPPGLNSFCLKKAGSVQDKQQETTCRQKRGTVIDFTPLKDITLDVYYVGKWLHLIGLYSISWYTPVRSELLGIDPQTAALHAVVLGIVVTVITLILSPVGDLRAVSKGLMFTVGLFLTAGYTLGSVALNQSMYLYITAAILGLLQGISLAVDIAFYVEVCGQERLAPSTGWFAFVSGLAPLILHAIVGVLLDKTGNAHSPFYLAGVSLLLSALVYTWVVWTKRKRTGSKVDDINKTTQDTSRDKDIIMASTQEMKT